ncbi:unnamed protein product [Prunus armeniaca]
MNKFSFRQFSSLPNSIAKEPAFTNPTTCAKFGKRNWNSLPIPHKTIPEPKGQDLDFVNVANNHLIHFDFAKLNSLSNGLTTFRVKRILLKIKQDYVLSLEFFNWVAAQNPTSLTLETHSMILYILTKYRKFKSAESILRKVLVSGSIDLPSKLFEAILYSYRLCDSSPRVFDSLFKTSAHMKKFRNATNTFCQMKDYGFFPTVESCNAYLSSLLDLHRAYIALVFYREMQRCRISPNVYTLNMVISAYCRLGKLENAVEVLEKMDSMGFSPTVVSYNTLIAGHCDKGLLSSALKFKNLMAKNGLHPINAEKWFGTFPRNLVMLGLRHALGLGKAFDLQDNKRSIRPRAPVWYRPKALRCLSKYGFSKFELHINRQYVSFDVGLWTPIVGLPRVSGGEVALIGRSVGTVLKLGAEGFHSSSLVHMSDALLAVHFGKLKEANRVFSEMKAVNFAPDTVTYNTLIKGYSQEGNSEMGNRLFEEMSRNQVDATIVTYNALILGLCKEGKTKKAAHLVKELDRKRFEVLKEMFERYFALDSSILSDLCLGLCRCGNEKMVKLLCSEMEARCLIPQGLDTAKILSPVVVEEN